MLPLLVIRRWIIAALVVAVGPALVGCSALRIGYSTAPDLVYWWLDRYVDFDGTQTTRVREALGAWFTWNRRTQLPDYAALLVRARGEVLADTTAARVCEWQGEVMKRVDTAVARAAPAAAEIALTITPGQIAHIERRYARVNEEFRDDYLQKDLTKRAAATLKRTVERAEMLYGRLDDSQRARMAALLARSPFDPELWLTERRARQQDALDLLRKLNADKATREQAEAALRTYVDHLQRSPHEVYRRYSERLMTFNCAFAATLHNSTTAAQRGHAAKQLAGWESDLRALAAAADPN